MYVITVMHVITVIMYVITVINGRDHRNVTV